MKSGEEYELYCDWYLKAIQSEEGNVSEFGENYGSEILKYLNSLKHKFNKFISTHASKVITKVHKKKPHF